MVKYVTNVIKTLGEKLPWKKALCPALILLLGIVLLRLPGGASAPESNSGEIEQAAPQTFDFDLGQFTAETETLLSEIQGAGRVQLLFTLESDGTRDYLMDESRAEEDGRLERKTVLASQEGNQVPITAVRRYPVFRGALVVCQGGDRAEVRLAVKEAVASLTGLGMDHITVLKSK